MRKSSRYILSLSAALLLVAPSAIAQPRHGQASKGQASRGHAAPHGEPHQGPRAYQRVSEPKGWNKRPAMVDRRAYNHNYQAARSFKIGPYRPPVGWTQRHWRFGEILPRSYWAPPYILSDYWLFGLEVPPMGFEWVRDGEDAILVNMASGEILQVEYGVFA